MILDTDIPTLSIALVRHPRRKSVDLVVCEMCGARGLRYSSRATERMAHWKCINPECGHHWKEMSDVKQP